MPRRYDNGKKKKKEKKRRRKLLLQKKLGIEPKKKSCWFTKEGVEYIDYKEIDILKRYINDKGAILSGRQTGTSLQYQRELTLAIKRARYMALLPFCPPKYV